MTATYRKMFNELTEVSDMQDISEKLSGVDGINIVDTRKRGCTLKMKKSYKPENIERDIYKSLISIVQEAGSDIEIDQRFIDAALDVSVDKNSRLVYINYALKN